MSRRGRLAVAALGLAGLGALVLWAVTGLREFGRPPEPYASRAPDVVREQRHVDNTVGGVTFDLRGFDTLGEELILLVAATGASVLLRAQGGEPDPEAADAEEDERGPRTADAVRSLGTLLVGPVLVLGLYVVAHGAITPGGGFQGGVILAGALLLVYAAGQTVAVRRVRPVAAVEVAEAVGAAAFGLIALGGL